ncbi:MAG: DUF4291 domain-containing protein [Candidatus Parabeggiatoa sp. nov. 1]|nr:MAG: DUF4291 domain-containing protein [Gammaproteobacteria bacterium]
MSRKIFANYDFDGIYVYQAFKPSIVEAALEKGTFGKGFGFDRMTWIKPSYGWMLYRSGYATKLRQTAILKIKLSHIGFKKILSQSVQTTYSPHLYSSEREWHLALKASDVRHQWDPDRALVGNKLGRRAIQIGIRGETLCSYINEWIIGLQEVTSLARQIQEAIHNGLPLPDVPAEEEYIVEDDLATRLNISFSHNG